MKKKIYDADAALKHAGNQQELADEMLHMLRLDLEDYGVQLSRAIEQGDRATVSHLAHRMSGSARWCGAEELLDVAEAVLLKLRHDSSEPLDSLAARLQAAMSAFLAHSESVPG